MLNIARTMPLEEEVGAAEAEVGAPEAAVTAAEEEGPLQPERPEPFAEIPEAEEELTAAVLEPFLAAVLDIPIPAAADDGGRAQMVNPVPNTNEGTGPFRMFQM